MKKQTPSISIIIPVYKAEQYLRQCLDSIINQTLKNIEIIPVNDGSPDGCQQILDEYAQSDKRIKPLHQQNQGHGAAVYTGIKAATGDYIGFVDADDFIDKEMYQTLYQKVDGQPDIDIV